MNLNRRIKLPSMLVIAATLWLTIGSFIVSHVNAQELSADDFKKAYNLQQHSEGGWFAEIYTAPFRKNKRPFAGSIYFLLDKDEISHFHRLDCDEIWYYHAGCGMKIFVLKDGRLNEVLLGVDTNENQQPMIVLPVGSIFAAENLDKDSFTFISCATTPRFTYKGFKLVTRAELKKIYPRATNDLLKMAYEKL